MERQINPLFNVQEVQKMGMIINPYRYSGGNPVLIDSYVESNASSLIKLYNGYYYLLGQSFNNIISKTLNSCKFYLYRVGSPSGTICAKLYSHTGTFGTNSKGDSVLATSDSIDVTTISTNVSLVTFTFTGTNRITLGANTNYFIGVEYNGGNSTNYVFIYIDSSAPTHSGNCAAYSGTWTTVSSYDTIFYVYGI